MLGRKFRKHAIRNQWPRPRGKFLRRRNHELFNSEVHQRMSTWLLRWQWSDCAAHWMNQWLKDSANQWISGPMNQQVKKSMNQRITEVMNQRSNDWTTQWISETGEPTNQWLNGLATQWIKEFVSQRFRINQLLNDSDDSVSQWTNEPMTQWVIEPRKPWVNESMIPRFTEPMNDQCFINGSMNQWINKILNRWSSELLNHWIKESVNQWFNDFKSQWLNDSVNKRIKESIMLPTSSSKSAPIPPSFFAILKCKSSSVWHANRALATVSCAFCQRHLPKVLRSFFFRFWSANRALAAVAHFADLICQKCSESLGFVTLWSANLALATVSCTFCRQLPQIEPRNHGNRDPMGPSRIIRKHKGFRTRECFRPWLRTLNCCYTSQLLDGWHDDVGDKMVWMHDFPMTMMKYHHL